MPYADAFTAVSQATKCALCDATDLELFHCGGSAGPVFYYSRDKAWQAQVGYKRCQTCGTTHDLQGFMPGRKWAQSQQKFSENDINAIYALSRPLACCQLSRVQHSSTCRDILVSCGLTHASARSHPRWSVGLLLRQRLQMPLQASGRAHRQSSVMMRISVSSAAQAALKSTPGPSTSRSKYM